MSIYAIIVLHSNYTFYLHMCVICDFGDQIMCESISIHYAT
jgi:hypothetical protein